MTSLTPALDPIGRTTHSRAWLLLLLLTCGTMMAMDRADPDLWGHVQYGREWIQEGALPTTSTWTHTAVGYRWINHENLSELLLVGAYDWCGTWGLSMGKFLLSLLVVSLLIPAGVASPDPDLRASAPHLATLFLVAVVMSLGLEIHWHFRPQIMGYACAAAMLCLLTRSIIWENPGAGRVISIHRSIWLLALIMVIWTNSHGSVVAGLCMLWAYVGVLLMQLVWLSGFRVNREAVLLVAVLLVTTVATLLNPYGIRLHLWLVEALHVPRPEILDWARMPLWHFESVSFWVMLGLTGVCLWRSWCSAESRQLAPADRLQLPGIVLLVLVGVQAFLHIRHLPFLAITWGFVILPSLDQFVRSMGQELTPWLHRLTQRVPTRFVIRGSRHLIVGASLWAAFLGVHLGEKLTVLKVERDQFPVDAFEFIARNRLEGRTIVTFNWAQYAIGLFAHEGLKSTVSFDGRFRTCYPQHVIDTHFDFVMGPNYVGTRFRSPGSPPLDPYRALTEADPELVVISRLQKHSEQVMLSRTDDWSLLYQDGLAQVWGRKTVFDDPASPQYLAIDRRRFQSEVPAGFFSWPAFPGRVRLAGEQLAGP